MRDLNTNNTENVVKKGTTWNIYKKCTSQLVSPNQSYTPLHFISLLLLFLISVISLANISSTSHSGSLLHSVSLGSLQSVSLPELVMASRISSEFLAATSSSSLSATRIGVAPSWRLVLLLDLLYISFDMLLVKDSRLDSCLVSGGRIPLPIFLTVNSSLACSVMIFHAYSTSSWVAFSAVTQNLIMYLPLTIEGIMWSLPEALITASRFWLKVSGPLSLKHTNPNLTLFTTSNL